jgi:uridine kinase
MGTERGGIALVKTSIPPDSLEASAGQMLVAGWTGTEVSAEAADLIARGNLGGLIIFGRNLRSAAQARELSGHLQEIAAGAVPRSRAPLLIAIDQEGGPVSRFTAGHGATAMPGNADIGAVGSADAAYRAARATALELEAVGVNWNYAPVVDVFSNPANPVIADRSYGTDPALVARLGAAAVRGCQDGGVMATAKHFPGHGDTDTDSHLTLPCVPHDRARLDRVELPPFRAAVAAGAGAIMTAHVTVPAIEPCPGLPATLSRAVLTGLLREEMGFDGLIVTDCLEMAAIADRFGVAEAAVAAIRAGADMALISHTAARQWGPPTGCWLRTSRPGRDRAGRRRHVERALPSKEGIQLSRRPVFIGIGGGTGSGKTTVARAILERLAGRNIGIIEQDAYYRELAHLPFDERVKVNFDHPLAFDTELFLFHLDELAAGRAVEKPIYSFKTHTRTRDTVRVGPHDVVILEGIMILEDARVRERLDIKLYVDTDPDVRILRRVLRDIRERGRSLESIIEQYLEVVRPMHLQFVEPAKRYADIIIPEGGENVVAIDVIVAKIEWTLRR